MESKLRKGFTTGSCSAAAAKASAYMLLTGKEKTQIEIMTPAGILFKANIVDIVRTEDSVSCAVIKDGGDDPDVTTGAHIVAKVWVADTYNGKLRVFVDGGLGVGRVTKPGLDQPVGNAAINRVPRQMIFDEVTEICNLCDYSGDIFVEISVPEGRTLAESTFNKKLGIVDGISILGTSGIVEPMSFKALLDTIKVEINQKKAMGYEYVAVSPGNYGLQFMKNTFDYDLDLSVKCSNFIGDTIDMAKEAGFHGMLLTGHIGKLIKVSGGMMNTHSKEGDCRMELLAAAAILAGCTSDTAKAILEAVNTEEGIRILSECNLVEKTMSIVMDRITFYFNRRAGNDFKIEVMLYSNDFGLLAKSENAEYMLNILKEY